MTSFRAIEKFGRNYVPAPFASVGKSAVSYLRYYAQWKKARKGFNSVGHKYINHIFFIAGLPKSGTTWLEGLLTAHDEITSVMPPQAVLFEQRNGGSHKFELNSSVLSSLDHTLSLMKLHCHGSANNINLLREFDVPVVSIFRDLRDVAVSYVFYIKNTPYHPEYRKYKSINMNEALARFSREMLPEYRDWIYSWKEYENSPDVFVLKYEELHNDTVAVLRKVFDHFQIEVDHEELSLTIESRSFRNMSKGVSPSKVDTSTFFRKGVIGDWVNHFDEISKDLFKSEIASLLIELGYEDDDNW